MRKKMSKQTSQLGANTAGGNSAYGREGHDFYPTPNEATLALIKQYNHRLYNLNSICEPACGSGVMADLLQKELSPKNLLCFDIRETGYAKQSAIQDFTDKEFIFNTDAIITNPPFNLADQFIQRSHDLNVPFYAFVLKATYFHAKKRLPLFSSTHPTAVHPLLWRPLS